MCPRKKEEPSRKKVPLKNSFNSPIYPLTAAAEQKDESYDDEPDGAVIEKVAKTVIHNVPPKEFLY